MKKFLPLVVGVVLLIGVGLFIRGKQSVTGPQGEREGITPASQSVPETGGVISSIKDAMGLGKKMKCTYSVLDDKGKPISSTIIIDGQKYKFAAETNGEMSYGIFDGETQYMWSGVTKQGLKMTKSCIDELSKSVPTDGKSDSFTVPETPQDFEQSFGSAENVKCEPTNEDFSLPTDVNFIDQCEMMRESLKALEGIKGNLPAGVNIPGY